MGLCMDFTRLRDSKESQALDLGIIRMNEQYESSIRFLSDALSGLASFGVHAAEAFASVLTS